jgi:hypothetical protein
MNSVHIVGLDHFLQNVNDRCLTVTGIADERLQKARLADMLRGILHDADVNLIAEEGKLDGSCLGAVLAKENGLQYVDITMPLRERERHGIETPGYDRDERQQKIAYRVFEGHMFETVKSKKMDTSLVMCGRRHLKALATLFAADGYRVLTYDVFDFNWYVGRPIEEAEGVTGHDRDG